MFRCSPGCHLVLSADLAVVAVTDAYLRATLMQRQYILGRHLFDVLPDTINADDVASLRESLERVLATARPELMNIQQSDIRRPESPDTFEARYQSQLNTPVLDDTGKVEYVIHSVEDVTELVRVKELTRQDVCGCCATGSIGPETLARLWWCSRRLTWQPSAACHVPSVTIMPTAAQ
ncbi:MAG: multi-sensor Hybrid histidine Kinase [Pseudomonadota bacterium]|jgi:hypothetical protein